MSDPPPMSSTPNSTSIKPSLCLTCYVSLPTSIHPPSFRYSCCNRQICSACISQYPRLITYCANCEGAASALRKGRRNDVTRRGDVVFDAFREEQGDQERVVLRVAGDGDEQLPAYSSNAFSIGDDNDNDDQESGDEQSGKYAAEKKSKMANRPVLVQGEDKLNTLSASSKVNLNPNSTPSSSSNLVPDLVMSSRAKSIPTDPELDKVSSSASHFQNISNLQPINSDPFSSNRIKVTKESLEEEKANSQEERNKRKGSAQQRNLERVRNAGEETRQYFLRKEDNLQKISLLFNVSIHTLLQINQLSTPSLLHTRSFILIPSSAVEKCLEKASDSQHSSLSQALSGPPRLSTEAKIKAARLATEGKFRAMVTRNSNPYNPDEIQADERASKAYISFIEEELKWVDFGDDAHLSTPNSNTKVVGKAASEPLTEEEAIEEERKDLARQNRFDSILKQAIARWEMDSEWERSQRINGQSPRSLLSSDISSHGTNGKGKGKGRSWLDRLSLTSSNHSSTVQVQGDKIISKA